MSTIMYLYCLCTFITCMVYVLKGTSSTSIVSPWNLPLASRLSSLPCYIPKVTDKLVFVTVVLIPPPELITVMSIIHGYTFVVVLCAPWPLGSALAGQSWATLPTSSATPLSWRRCRRAQRSLRLTLLTFRSSPTSGTCWQWSMSTTDWRVASCAATSMASRWWMQRSTYRVLMM